MRRKKFILLTVCVIMVLSVMLCLTGCDTAVNAISNYLDTVAYNWGISLGYQVVQSLLSLDWGKELIEIITLIIRNVWLWIFH